MSEKRCCIVGTAPTWIQTPWNDPEIEIWLLNDVYNAGPIQRASRWFDLHPISAMHFRAPGSGKFVHENEVPEGKHYIRPHNHLEFLRKTAETIPVFLQEVPDGWPPNAQRFPIEDVMTFLKARPDQVSYVASSPAMMIALAAIEGYAEIQIFGIHLATEHEYREQRPSMEWLLGRLAERGVRIILPKDCPLLKHTHVYGYEPKPAPLALEPRKKLMALEHQKAKLVRELVLWPRWKSKDAKLEELRKLDAQIVDCTQQIQRAHVYAA